MRTLAWLMLVTALLAVATCNRALAAETGPGQDASFRLRLAEETLAVAEEAAKPEVWFTVRHQLRYMLFSASKQLPVQVEADAMLADLAFQLHKPSAANGVAMDKWWVLTNRRLQQQKKTGEAAALWVKLKIIEANSTSEGLQRKRDNVEILRNGMVTLEQLVAGLQGNDLQTPPLTPEGLKYCTFFLDKLQAAPGWKQAQTNARAIAKRVETEELRQSRARVADLRAQALKQVEMKPAGNLADEAGWTMVLSLYRLVRNG